MKPKKDPKFVQAIKALDCMGCGHPAPSEAHHVTTKRFVGDEPGNLIPLCDYCHRSSNGWHGGKWTFLNKHPQIVEYLKVMGWDIDLVNRVMNKTF